MTTGGKSRPVYVVTDAEIASGAFSVAPGPATMVASLDELTRGVSGGYSVPVYVVDMSEATRRGVIGGQAHPVFDMTDSGRPVGGLQQAIPVYVVLGSLGEVVAPPVDDGSFITTWKTDNAGMSNNDQIRLPLPNVADVYDFEVSWGDGSHDHITAFDDAAVTHTYAAVGTYTVTITGTLKRFQFANGGDTLKVLTVEQWGSDPVYTAYDAAWWGCSNVLFNAVDVPDMASAGTNFGHAWDGCIGLTSFPALDLSAGTDFTSAWNACVNIAFFLATGMNADFMLPCDLDAAALDVVYGNVNDRSATTSQNIDVTGNPGVGGDDSSIATAKNWTVTGTQRLDFSSVANSGYIVII